MTSKKRERFRFQEKMLCSYTKGQKLFSLSQKRVVVYGCSKFTRLLKTWIYTTFWNQNIFLSTTWRQYSLYIKVEMISYLIKELYKRLGTIIDWPTLYHRLTRLTVKELRITRFCKKTINWKTKREYIVSK